MLIVKEGRKLKQAWRIYKCDTCGQMEAECRRQGQANGPSYSNDILEGFADPYVNRDEIVHFCSNCGHEMRQPELSKKAYIDFLIGKEIPLCNDMTKILTEEDLYY